MNQLTTFATRRPLNLEIGECGQHGLADRGEALAGEGLDLEGAGSVAHAGRRVDCVAAGRLVAIRGRESCSTTER
jgi:hypothetical protein